MNRKRNVSYIKPEDPEFLKVLKRQAGYDDRNHKFDELQNDEKDFVEDNDESEQPQIVVLKAGDLTAEQAEEEKKRIDQLESETKADLSQRVIFKGKQKNPELETNKRKHKQDEEERKKSKITKKNCQLLSFDDDNDDEQSS